MATESHATDKPGGISKEKRTADYHIPKKRSIRTLVKLPVNLHETSEAFHVNLSRLGRWLKKVRDPMTSKKLQAETGLRWNPR